MECFTYAVEAGNTSMTIPIIKLSDIVDAMQIQSETMTHYLNKKTGKIVLISQEDADAAENDEIMEEFPEWQQEDIKLAREVWGSNHYILLPTKFDIHEYDLIVNFCLSIRNKKVSRSLYDLTRGRGAFKRFYDGICHYNVEEDWYEYKNAAYREIAKRWCSENKIEFKEGD